MKFFNYPKLELELTKHCNLACSYCGAQAFLYKQPLEMDIKFLKILLKILEKNKKLPNIILSGGEPTLHTNFEEIKKILNKFETFLITNLIKFEDFSSPFHIIFSIHLDYLNYYLTDNFYKKVEKIIKNDTFFQFQFVLPDFNKIKNKDLLKKFVDKYKTFLNFKNVFVHYQFIINHSLPPSKKFKVINFKNIKNYEKFLNPFLPKPFFFDNNFYRKYIQNIDFYLKNNFNLKNYFCENNNFKLSYDFNLYLECDSKIFLKDLKKNPFEINMVINNKKLICSLDFCDPQISGYCKKIKRN